MACRYSNSVIFYTFLPAVALWRTLVSYKGTSEAEVHKLSGMLDIITSDIGLEKANNVLAAKFGKERYLRRAIDKIAQTEKYEFVILDSNPSFSQLTINVLYASEKVLVPFKPEYNSFKGIMQLFENIEEMKEIQPNLDVLGFVITMARRAKSTDEAITAIKNFAKNQGCRVFSPAIRLAVDAADAPSHNRSLYDYKPNSNVTKDYERLGEAVLEALGGE